MSNTPPAPPAPSGYPLLGHALQFASSPFDFVENSREAVGDVYLMQLPGRDVYTLTRPDHFRRALVTEIDSFAKTDDFERVFGDGLLSTEGTQWSRQRGVMQPMFRRERIDGYAPQMVEAVRRRLDTWADGEVRDIETEMRDLTLEILFATLFGRELLPGDGEELRAASDGLNKWFVPTSWLLPHWVPTPARWTFYRSSRRLRTEVRRLLAEQRYGSGRSDDEADDRPAGLIELLRRAGDATGEAHLSDAEMEDQMLTMLFAGYETTAAALGFAWFELATNPDIRHDFHRELDDVLGGRQPTPDDIAALELTGRIVKETLRLYPPVPTIPRQTTRPVDVDGYRLPADEQVHLSVIAAHRDERSYDDPKSFRPNRWVDGFEEELEPFAYIPFGGGRRTCIGRGFATLEAVVVLATVGQQYRFEWVGDDTPISIEPEITTRTQDGLPMRMRSR